MSKTFPFFPLPANQTSCDPERSHHVLKSQHNNSYAITYKTILFSVFVLIALHCILRQTEFEITCCQEMVQNHKVAAQNEQSASWYLQFCNFLNFNKCSKSRIILNCKDYWTDLMPIAGDWSGHYNQCNRVSSLSI